MQDFEDGSKTKKGDAYHKKLKLDIAATLAEANKMAQELETSLIFPKYSHAVPLGGKRYAVAKTFKIAVYVNLTVEKWERLCQTVKEIVRCL